MNRTQLEHIIRASAGNADTTDIVIIGSQSLLGTFADAPEEKDLAYLAALFRHGLASPEIVRNRLSQTTADHPLALARLKRLSV